MQGFWELDNRTSSISFALYGQSIGTKKPLQTYIQKGNFLFVNEIR